MLSAASDGLDANVKYMQTFPFLPVTDRLFSLRTLQVFDRRAALCAAGGTYSPHHSTVYGVAVSVRCVLISVPPSCPPPPLPPPSSAAPSAAPPLAAAASVAGSQSSTTTQS